MTAATNNAPKPIDPRGYPALREAFKGYLHEDWATEYADAADAARAFRRDSAEEELRAVAAEAARLRVAVAGMEVRDLRKLLGAGFGSGWRPSTAAEADKVLRLLANE